MYTVRERTLIAYFRLRSYLKSSWSFEDYPISTRPNGQQDPVREWLAQFLNWPGPVALGATPDEAVRNLKAVFEKIRANRAEEGEQMPRPGASEPIRFASTAKLERHAELLDDFVGRVLGFGPGDSVFLSDKSSLYDFAENDGEYDRYVGLIRSNYGVDVKGIEGGNIARILNQIAQSRRSGVR
jgi:predicted RNase H-like HicB family nuclease